MNNLETIIELQGAVTELRSVEARLSGIPDWMRELHDEHGQRRAEIASLDEEVETAARDRRAAEAAIADAQERLRKYQQQISLVATQREYGALLKEIDTVKVEIARREEEGLAALERHEKARTGGDTQRQAFAELDSRYASELAKWEAEKPAVSERATALRERIATLRGQLPRPMLSAFDRVLAKHGGEGLAAVRRGDRIHGSAGGSYSCSACNYRVRPQVVVEIRNGGNLVQCDACKRILYVPEGL